MYVKSIKRFYSYLVMFVFFRRYLLFVYIAIFSNCLLAQKKSIRTIDSLLPHLNLKQIDTQQVKILYTLSSNYYILDHQRGIQYGEQAMELAKKLNWQKGMARAHNSIANCCWAKSDYVRAQDEYQKAIVIFEKLGMIGDVVNNYASIAAVNYAQNEHKKALANYQRALNYLDNQPRKRSLTYGRYDIIVNMAMTHSAIGNKDNAIAFYLKAAEGFLEENKMEHYTNALQLLAEVYASVGQDAKALELFKKVEKMSLQFDYQITLAKNFLKLAFFYQNRSAFDKAIELAKKSADLFEAEDEKGEVAFAVTRIGVFYMEQVKADDTTRKRLNQIQRNERLNKAIYFLEKGIALARPVTDQISLKNMYKSLSDASAMVGDHQKAYRALMQFQNLKDSLDKQENSKAYLTNQFEFEFSRKADSVLYVKRLDSMRFRKDIEITNAKQTGRWVIVLSAMGLISILLFYFVQQNRANAEKLKKALESEQLQKEFQEASYKAKLNDLSLLALKVQMNPHFIFNCLNSIKLLTEQNESEQASLYLTRFSKLIRKMLDSSTQDRISLADELAQLQLYLEMEQMRLKEKLSYSFQLTHESDYELIYIPPMFIQPFVENAIWHGLMPMQQGGKIEIRFYPDIENKTVEIMITDNGVGIHQTKKDNNSEHVSMGNRLISEKMELLRQKYSTDFQWNAIDLSSMDTSQTGTQITIKLPMI